MKRNLLVIVVFISSFVYAQVPPAVYEANRAFEAGNYFKAAESTVKAYNGISPKREGALEMKASLAYKAGFSFERLFNNKKAIEWYERAVTLQYFHKNPFVYYNLGKLFQEQGDYDKAKENYERFLELRPINEQAKTALASLKIASFIKQTRKRYIVKSETKINTKGMDMAPSVAGRRRNAIVFGSTRPSSIPGGIDPISGEGFFNIWRAEKDRSGNWTAPKLFEAEGLNTESNEGTIAFDGRYRKAFFTRCIRVEDKNIGCQIWEAERRGRSYTEPVKIPIAPNDSFSVGHPCPNEDGTILLFASDIPGGVGGMDLWYIEYDRREKKWAEPVNLGKDINTPGDELFPTYSMNGDLYFASNGHEGLGGLDVYIALKTDEKMKFENPINMGAPINSDANDYHLIEMDEKNGFFTSNREGSLGTNNDPDIWSYVIPPNLFSLKVVVSEVGNNNKIEGAQIQVSGSDGSTFTGSTNAAGEVFWDKNPEGGRYINEKTDYTIQVLPVEGYHPNNKTEAITTEGLKVNQMFVIEMALAPKTPIVLPEVRYDYNSAVLQVNDEVNSKDSLNFVYDLLQEYPGMVLRLVAHTDSRGSDSYNERLSQARAKSCVDYLVNEKGVDPNRLVAEGRGENDPRIVFLVDGNYYAEKPEGQFEAVKLTVNTINKFKGKNEELFLKLHQYNRRTEAEVIRMDYDPNAGSTTEETTENQ